MSPVARISRSGTIMYCGVPVFAYKIIWASILPQTDLCHSEDSFTSPSLSLHWSLLNFPPLLSAPFPRRCYFFPKCPTFALAVRDVESDGAVVINKFYPCRAIYPPSPSPRLYFLFSGATSRGHPYPRTIFFFSSDSDSSFASRNFAKGALQAVAKVSSFCEMCLCDEEGKKPKPLKQESQTGSLLVNIL